MQIEKEVKYKIELDKEEFLLIKAALARFIEKDDAITNREHELAPSLYECMCKVYKNA